MFISEAGVSIRGDSLIVGGRWRECTKRSNTSKVIYCLSAIVAYLVKIYLLIFFEKKGHANIILC